MTLANFLKHIKKQGCTSKPLEGRNLTGVAIELFNPKNNKRYYLQIYKGGEISKTTIVHICSVHLFIDLPENY